MKKSLPSLTVADISKHPLWRFTNNDEDELEVESLTTPPVGDLSGVIAGIQVKLADGTQRWALLQGISRDGQPVNEHFLSITMERGGKWFPLARYHDVAIETYGPIALARFLEKPAECIFPIHYDLRHVLESISDQLVGTVHLEPKQRLTREEIIASALIKARCHDE
jgi:hypothetical protein